MLCSFCLDGTRHRGASCAPTRLMTPRRARVSQKLWQIDLSSFTRDVECPSVGMIFAHSFSERSAMAVRPSLRTQSSGAKSVKQALIVRLRQHANEFGLTKEDGNPNEQGIEDVAKIASWDTRGGAPKTPGSERLPSSAAAIRPPIASDARRRGSASRCAYRCVVDACVCPNSLPMIGRLSPPPAPKLA